MKLLLDTHVFLWLITGDRRLPAAWLSPISDPENQVYLSVASIWECVIKSRAGGWGLRELHENEKSQLEVKPSASQHV